MTSCDALMGGVNLLASEPLWCTPPPYGDASSLHGCVEKFSKAGGPDTHLIRHLFNEEHYIDYDTASSDNDNHPVGAKFAPHPIIYTPGRLSQIRRRRASSTKDIITKMSAKAAAGTCTKNAIGLA
jgi:hypothetical protein